MCDVQEIEKPSEVPIITNPVKTKNPKRVEQGKRLAQISKQAKERKKRERIDAEVTKRIKAVADDREDREVERGDREDVYTSAIEYVVLPTGVIGLIAYLFYKKYLMSKPQQKVPEVQKPDTNFISPD